MPKQAVVVFIFYFDSWEQFFEPFVILPTLILGNVICSQPPDKPKLFYYAKKLDLSGLTRLALI